ncbi:hypothetical protein COY31_02140, partial [Candidatus Wolfebacteria bacterium CG_4_10_14_0_2_um_filter_39_18]
MYQAISQVEFFIPATTTMFRLLLFKLIKTMPKDIPALAIHQATKEEHLLCQTAMLFGIFPAMSGSMFKEASIMLATLLRQWLCLLVLTPLPDGAGVNTVIPPLLMYQVGQRMLSAIVSVLQIPAGIPLRAWARFILTKTEQAKAQPYSFAAAVGAVARVRARSHCAWIGTRAVRAAMSVSAVP